MAELFNFKLAWWQTRGQAKRIWLLILCIALGVSANVAVRSFKAQLNRTLMREGRNLLTADLEIAKRTPLSDSETLQLKQILPENSRTQQTLSFVTMAAVPGTNKTRLIELKAIEPSYPFFGQLILSSINQNQLFSQQPFAYVQPELLIQLGIKPGDSLRIGKTDFIIAGTILKEPGLGSGVFSLGPRVLIGIQHVFKTGLINSGSRVYYSTLAALPNPSQAEIIANKLKELWGTDQKGSFYSESMGPSSSITIRTFRDKQFQIERSFNRFGDYLRLASVMVLLLAGIGVGGIVRGFVMDRLDSFALLRILGASANRAMRIDLIQILVLAIAGSFLGAILGSLIQYLFPAFLKGFLPIALEKGFDLRSVLSGTILGVLVSCYFAFLPLLEVRKTKPFQIFRKEPVQVLKGWSFLIFILSGVILLGIISSIEARSMEFGMIFTGILLGGGVLLRFAGHYALVWISGLSSKFSKFGFKHGTANLMRPGLHPHAAIVVLGLSALFLGIMTVYESSLLKEMDPGQSADKLPNFFLIDIQNDQVEPLKNFLNRHQITQYRLSPMIKARYRALNGKPVQDVTTLTRDDESAQSMRHREQNLSYREQLGEDETIIKGKWIGERSNEIEASLEEWFAERIGAKLGDQLTFDVQGVAMVCRVTGIRKVRWSSFRPNFFILVSPWALKGAPQTWVGSLGGISKDTLNNLQSELVTNFPNVTIFDVAQTSQKILHVIRQILWAIRFLGLFSLGAGLIVLAAIALATARQRQREATLLRVLGATRPTIVVSIAVEFFCLGIIATVIGLILSLVFGWGMMVRYLEMSFSIPWMNLGWLSIILVLVCSVTGVLACRKVFTSAPLNLLREN